MRRRKERQAEKLQAELQSSDPHHYPALQSAGSSELQSSRGRGRGRGHGRGRGRGQAPRGSGPQGRGRFGQGQPRLNARQKLSRQYEPSNPTLSTPRKRSGGPTGSRGTPAKLKSPGTSEPSPYRLKRVEPRRLPVFRKSELETLRSTIREMKVEPNDKFDYQSVLDHGLLFYYVEVDMVIFASPSGSTIEIEVTDILGKELCTLVCDPHITKVGDRMQMKIIQLTYNVKFGNHFDPAPFGYFGGMKFKPENLVDRADPNPKDYILLKAVRKARTLILNYWECVVGKTVVKTMDPATNLSPWSRLLLAKFADSVGRSPTYTATLTVPVVAGILDKSPYYSIGPLDLPGETSREVHYLGVLGQESKFNTEVAKASERKEILAKINENGCPYPICVAAKANAHPFEKCNMIGYVCDTCTHRGHLAGDHIDYDQVILDHMFRVYAPSHVNAGYVWQAVETASDDWASYLYAKPWEERHNLEAGLPPPRPPTATEIRLQMKRQEVDVGSEEILLLEAQASEEDLARRVARQAEADAAARKRKFGIPVLPILDPVLTNEEVLADLLRKKAVRDQIAALQKEAADYAETQRLHSLVEPMPLLSHEVAASIIEFARARTVALTPPQLQPPVPTAVVDPPPPEVTPVIPLRVHEEIPDLHLLDDTGPMDNDSLMLSDTILFEDVDDDMAET